MKHEPFKWTKPRGIADMQELCEWRGLILWATPVGEWRVVRINEGAPGSVLVSHKDQCAGENLAEAKQRAQAAAMAVVKESEAPKSEERKDEL